MLAYEKQFWTTHGGQRLAGVDEAGRGPLAGPVVAGAACLSPELAESLYHTSLAGLTDSKQLTAEAREHFFKILTTTPDIETAVGLADAAEIDDINILRATHRAMARAVSALPGGVPNHVLVDGLPVKGLPCSSAVPNH